MCRRPRAPLVACGLVIALAGSASVSGAAPWRPAPTPLSTRWAADVSPESAHPEYPRPQMLRDDWSNLNGLWQLSLTAGGANGPGPFDRTVLVPFPVESSLSGVGEQAHGRALWYRRSFEIPAAWVGRRVLLHFGAVDWDATVWVNGRQVARHRGGYDHFTADVTDALYPFGPQQVEVRVTDPTDAGTQPRGKQVRDPHGIWYTPSSGIWQTVWLEPVPASHIRGLGVTTDTDSGTVRVAVDLAGPGIDSARLEARLSSGGRSVAEASAAPGHRLLLSLARPHLWSPADPFLYDLEVRLVAPDGTPIDTVASYVGMRSISVGSRSDGPPRLLLNGRPLFEFGVLDQGFWPDGLYTAPTDQAQRFDLATAKRLGFNMVRKHVKVEPDTYYAWADRLGLLVWQDMPSAGPFAPQGAGEITRDPTSAAEFENELTRIVTQLRDHPSVVMWVLFNEGWGQYDTARLSGELRRLDPCRLVDAASGWNDMGVGDVVDLHRYPGPDAPPVEPARAAVLGEFGGLGLPVAGLTWVDQGSWGYQGFSDPLTWSEAYARLLEKARSLAVERGLAAAVYTQLTDVESEVNGLMTYDRSLVKAEPTRLREAARKLTWPLPQRTTLVPTAEAGGARWRYVTELPPPGWMGPAFDDAGWATGTSGFGRPDSPGAIVGTPWTTRELWLRLTFTVSPSIRAPNGLVLRVHHDEDVDVWLNGTPLVSLPFYTSTYVDVPLGAAAAAALVEGRNVLALHCRQLGYGQYCDAGLAVLRTGAAP